MPCFNPRRSRTLTYETDVFADNTLLERAVRNLGAEGEMRFRQRPGGWVLAIDEETNSRRFGGRALAQLKTEYNKQVIDQFHTSKVAAKARPTVKKSTTLAGKQRTVVSFVRGG